MSYDSSSFDQLMSRLVTRIGRKTYRLEHLDTRDDRYRSRIDADTVGLDTANLVSSELPNGRHAPNIDLDFPSYLVASSTPGKFHLYIETELTWDQYAKLLMGLHDAGLIQSAWYRTALNNRRTYTRLPHVKKGDNP